MQPVERWQRGELKSPATGAVDKEARIRVRYHRRDRDGNKGHRRCGSNHRSAFLRQALVPVTERGRLQPVSLAVRQIGRASCRERVCLYV